MKFGRFDDVQKEYVIDTPATPLPWINYLGNEEFFGLISNTMGGYCFYRDAKLLTIGEGTSEICRMIVSGSVLKQYE